MFCAGGDLKSFADQADRLGPVLKEMTIWLHGTFSRVARMRAPVVTAVNGIAAGGGFGLAMCSDLVIAGESAAFTMAFTAAGLSPDSSSTWFLPRIIGQRRAQELMLTNRRIDAREAHEWGLVTRVVADDALADEATERRPHPRERPDRGVRLGQAAARRDLRQRTRDPDGARGARGDREREGGGRP